ncbi:MAG: cAMP-binding protein [Verrucomicrobiaceae bacterium]|nr:cAMP-binding protein [Verrucomicrobiaceae bacterium]
MEALDILARCYPFHQIDRQEVAALEPRMKTCEFKRGQTLLKRSAKQSDQLSYLISGSVELRRSFFDRVIVQAGSDAALQPLDYLLLSDGGQIVAQDDCVVVQIGRDLIDRSLAANAPNDYNVASLHETDLTDEYLVSDGNVAVDWMSRFLQSPLAQNLPALSIQQVLARLVTIDAVKGDAIVRRGSAGDALYIVLRGMAYVQTDAQGVYKGREISLMPGDYFGEESLVADTPRNATVLMESDGAVARLDRDAFDELIRPHVISEADDALMERSLLADADEKLVVIDVRFPVEFRRDGLPHSINIPISLLRARLHLLDKQRVHLITHHGGRRSELAVFLLRQAGFNAHLMASAEHRFGHVAAFDRGA